MSCDMRFDGCQIEARTLVFDVCGKREQGVIRSVEDLDNYIFEFGMPNKVVFKNFDMTILEQEFQQIIKVLVIMWKRMNFQRILNMYLMGLK